MVAVGMAKPRKAREKERGGAFLRDLKRTSSTTMARVNILVGIRAGRDWWAREERAAHIRWKIKGRGVLAHIKAREIWTCPVLTVGQRLQNTAPSNWELKELKGKSAKEKMHSKHQDIILLLTTTCHEKLKTQDTDREGTKSRWIMVRAQTEASRTNSHPCWADFPDYNPWKY